MSWIEPNKILGIVGAGSKQIIKYKPEGKVKSIVGLQSSCGCSTPTWDNQKQELIVTYVPKKVPVHLNQNQYTTRKTVTVTYQDGTKDVLSFTATIKKKKLLL